MNSEMSPERMKEIRERVEKATKGPWTIRREDGDRYLDGEAKGYSALMCDTTYYPWTPEREEDWQFIAHARQDIPDLLAEVERLRAAPLLTFARFAAMNRARCESPTGFRHTLASWSTSDWFLAALGELGEAANVAKKLNRVRDGIPGNKQTPEELRDKLRQELGDVFVYLDLMAQALGFEIGEAALEVFESKSKEIGYESAPSLPAPLGQDGKSATKEK